MSEINIDPTFAVNDYNQPKMLSNKETYVNNIMMLLFGKPGFYPSIPSIGMDIQQYLYKFEDEVNTEEIKNKLSLQCKDFLPEIRNGDLDVVKTMYNGRMLLIFKLPIIDDTESNSVILGVSTNTQNEIIYNFIDSNTEQVL